MNLLNTMNSKIASVLCMYYKINTKTHITTVEPLLYDILSSEHQILQTQSSLCQKYIM